MRTASLFWIAASAMTLVTLSSGVSHATKTSEALAMCVARGTACSVANKGGSYEICVNNTNGRECVSCPDLTSKNQTCTRARTAAAGGSAIVRNKAQHMLKSSP